MTEDATQPAGSRAGREGLWQVWRWMIAVAIVAMLVGAVLMTAPQPDRFALALRLSAQQLQEGRYQEAVDSAKVALAADPNSADAYSNLAVSYLGLLMYDEAIQAAQEAIRLRPDYQLAKNNLAWIQREKAQATLPSVPAAQIAEANALINQSLQHSGAGRLRECIDTATQAARLNPNSAVAFNNIGFCAANLGQWDEAIRNTQEAIRLDPTLQLAKNNLVWMQQERLKALAEQPQ